jgi:hypothetical protein
MRRDTAPPDNRPARLKEPAKKGEDRTLVSWNTNRSCGSASAIGGLARWLGKWVGAFSVAALAEADAGFASTQQAFWAAYTEHGVTERYCPDHCRTLRAIVHSDSRQYTNVRAGRGRFLVCDQQSF